MGKVNTTYILYDEYLEMQEQHYHPAGKTQWAKQCLYCLWN